MTKRSNTYKITLEEVSLMRESETKHERIELEFENHDNIFQIIKTLQEKNIFESKAQATEFGIGIKLFTEVLMKSKNNPLFTELIPAMSSFMRKLKAQ